MKVSRFQILLIFSISSLIVVAQPADQPGKRVPDAFCISTMEYKLFSMINAYRQRYDLPPVPLSKSLCFVASTHVNDLFDHHPDKGTCNSHSWSDQGNWKPFCYPRDENKKNSVWDKPKEITSYRGKGFEIVYWENDAVVIDSIIAFWKSMDYFNSFLMNTGKWQGKKWNAIGIGIHENYACAWFGELPDPEGEPLICGQEPKQFVTIPKEKNGLVDKKEFDKVAVEKKVPEKKAEQKKTLPVAKKREEPLQPNTTAAPNVSGKEYYYIIVKGVSPDKELERFLKDIQSKGYSSSRLLERNGKKRISIMEFPDKGRADSALRQIKKTWLDAWILKQ